MSTSSKLFALLLLTLMIGGGVAFLWWNEQTGPVNSGSTQPISVEIPEGAGTREVAALLEEAGVISNAFVFNASAALDERASQIRPGVYELNAAMSVSDILDVLTEVPPEAPTFTVTIPEGLTVEQTLQRIADAEASPHTVDTLRAALALVAVPEWVPAAELPEGAEPFEGLLFPNTYEFLVVAPPEEVLTRLVQETVTVMEEVGPGPELDLYDTLTLASLIEREARLAEERPQIASVIYNRLEIGQALQIDATVVYAIGRDTGETPTSLTTADYEYVSLWSTYINPGLPPTPISASGRSSIEAAATPAETDFFYYVVEDEATGRHRFSRTFEEHQQAIAEIRGGGG